MDKVKRPRGLIRYDSFGGIKNGEKLEFTFRNTGYTALLGLLMTFFVFLLITRTDVETTILRSYGTLFQAVENNHFTNLYTVKVLNKTFDEMPIRLELLNPQGTLTMVGGDLNIKGQDKSEGAFFIDIPGDLLKGTETKVEVAVFANDHLVETVKTSFTGPRN